MNKKSTHVAAVLSLTLLSASTFQGCASPGKGTGIGAGAGAATGAAVGGIFGGWKGAAIGAGAGALAGGAVGNMLDKQANELKQVAETQRTAEGIVVKLKNDLLFNTNSAVLKPEAVANLSELGRILVKYPQDLIQVEGFTDNVGKQAYNETLSQRRAEAVKNVLIGQGVKENQMTVLGMGPTNPLASNTTSSGRAQNRRVELHINAPGQNQSQSQNQNAPQGQGSEQTQSSNTNSSPNVSTNTNQNTSQNENQNSARTGT